MSPLGEAYRRARERQDSTGDGRPEGSAPAAVQGEAQAEAVGPGGTAARPAALRRPSVTQTFVPSGSLPPQGGGGSQGQAASTGAADDLLLRASRVPAFAEGALRAGCDELAGLKAALYAAGLDRPPATILVASPASGAGTTAVAVGLAGELARDLSRRVLLVDADVRSPGVAQALRVDAGYDLADVLDMRADVGEAIIHSEVDNLSALVVRPNPVTGAARITAESLARPAAYDIFGLIESAFDYVVIDAGATEESASGAVLAVRATGAVLVLPVGITRTRACAARSAIESAGGRVLGVVLTGVRGSRAT